MNAVAAWCDRIERIAIQSALVFRSVDECEKIVAEIIGDPNSLISTLQYRLTSVQPAWSQTIGRPGTGEATAVLPGDFANEYQVTCRISYWRREDVQTDDADNERVNQSLTRLVAALWRKDARDTLSRLRSLIPVSGRSSEQRTIEAGVDTYGSVALCFYDIDHFKQVNDKLTQEVGDRVILEFGALLENRAPTNAVVLHRTGDEYIVLLLGGDEESALAAAYDLMAHVREHDFRTLGVPVAVSVGITVIDREALVLPMSELEKQAENALKPKGTGPDGQELGKQRGRARLAGNDTNDGQPASEHLRRLAVCLTKSSAAEQRPYASPWLNFVSRVTADAIRSSTDINSSVSRLLNWMAPIFDPFSVQSALPHAAAPGVQPRMSGFDLAMAVAHGRLFASVHGWVEGASDEAFEVRYNDAEVSASALVDVASNPPVVLWNLGPITTSSVALGRPVLAEQHGDTKIDTRRAVAVKIGHDPLPVPADLFIEIITIDDRPTRGGGLPDFWEASIARLASLVAHNSNCAAVFVIGKREFARQTVAKLDAVEEWSEQLDQLSYKTGLGNTAIRTAASRLAGRIHFPTTVDELVSTLHGTLLDLHTVSVAQETGRAPQRFLKRELQTAGLGLNVNDGCRVETVTEAYPLVLELARNASGEDEVRDQAGYRLRELVDFKVVLSSPEREPVPSFYQLEAESLEQYFTREFVHENGLFAKQFAATGQKSAVLEHVASALLNPERQFATRRAILVVPHEVTAGKDVSPLGLVSVRIVPRFVGDRAVLHFSYTWRTVEALVGFPYSLYGSVRYSQHLTEAIRTSVGVPRAATVTMGTVSYIAHSLHMVFDENNQIIARRIVEDASA